jgi:hypothetical protein
MLCAAPLLAEESRRVILPGTAIKGIEAMPRVTFIVPWQRSRMKNFPQLPAHSALDELYTPLSSRQLELDVEQDGRAVTSSTE